MKKILIISSVSILAVVSVMGQASINGNNAGFTSLQVEDPAIDGGVFVDVGKAASNAGFLGAGPGQVTISMFAAPNGTSLATLEAGPPVAVIQNSTSTVTSGSFAFGNPYVLPTIGMIFNGTSPIEIILFGITTLSNGHQYSGFSTEATGIIPATGSANPTTIFGSGPGLINSFVLTPVVVAPVPDQSSTMALSGLSAVALLFFGRRKSGNEL